MSKSNTSKTGLLDNACHSLQRGYEMFNKGREKKDPLALKEAIIWIHHGIELSIKQLLVQTNEYLIFENIDEAVRKLAYLRKQPAMSNASVLDLFSSAEGVYTVGFGKLVERAAIMLNLPELAQDTDLREKIDALTSYRNKIVHFSVDVKLDEVISLLGELLEPFLNLLEREISDKDFIEKCAPTIRENAKSIFEIYQLKYNEIEKRIEKLLEKFNGQEVPGELFNLQETVKLPRFQNISKEALTKHDFRVDVVAKTDKEDWLIEIKLVEPQRSAGEYLMRRLVDLYQRTDNIKVWLIAMGTEKVIIEGQALDEGRILISSASDIEELEHLLQKPKE